MKPTLARELVLDALLMALGGVSRDIGYIDVFYNRTRRHSHLGGVSPGAFEQAAS